MPKVITTSKIVYSFNELSPEAQEKALDDNRYSNTECYDWWEGVYDIAEIAAEILGIELGSKNGDVSIFFNGFYTQGSGSSFEGVYRYAKGCLKKIKKEFPEDETLQYDGFTSRRFGSC